MMTKEEIKSTAKKRLAEVKSVSPPLPEEGVMGAIVMTLRLTCPNYCPENDEQVTLMMVDGYNVLLRYVFYDKSGGRDGFDLIKLMSDMFPMRAYHYPIWIPVFLLNNPNLINDDENHTIYWHKDGDGNPMIINA